MPPRKKIKEDDIDAKTVHLGHHEVEAPDLPESKKIEHLANKFVEVIAVVEPDHPQLFVETIRETFGDGTGRLKEGLELVGTGKDQVITANELVKNFFNAEIGMINLDSGTQSKYTGWVADQGGIDQIRPVFYRYLHRNYPNDIYFTKINTSKPKIPPEVAFVNGILQKNADGTLKYDIKLEGSAKKRKFDPRQFVAYYNSNK